MGNSKYDEAFERFQKARARRDITAVFIADTIVAGGHDVEDLLMKYQAAKQELTAVMKELDAIEADEELAEPKK